MDAVLARDTPSGGVAWYLADRLGSVGDIVDNSGAVIDHIDYTAFGRCSTRRIRSRGIGLSTRGCSTMRSSGSTMTRRGGMIQRAERFVTKDPQGFAGEDTNLYRYVGNDPANAADPTGLQRAALSFPTDPNAIDSDQFNAIIFPALKGHIPPNTPLNQIPFNDYFESISY